jgi:hypothetical protein
MPPSLRPHRMGQTNVPPRPARDNDIDCAHISLAKGLSQSVVPSILRDSRGFMWFCTQDGLNRCDGYQFKVYKQFGRRKPRQR